MIKRTCRRRLVALGALLILWMLGCAAGPEDLVDDLSGTVDEREAATQELLLAKERAVGPLLAALADPGHLSARPALVEILISLMMRVEDDRIGPALTQLLSNSEDPALRARIIRLAGMHRRVQLLEAVMVALRDGDPQIRLEALIAVDSFESKLRPEQVAVLDSLARTMLLDSSNDVQREAMIRVASQVDAVLTKARQATLEARLAEAESLFAVALDIYPASQRAQYRLGRYLYENADPERGLDSLRAYGLLIDVPMLPSAPSLDGRLDDPVWRQAVRADRAVQFAFTHTAAAPAEHASHFYIGRTATSLWIGFYGEDDSPGDLVTNITPDEEEQADAYEGGPVGDLSIWKDDIIELFINTNFDHSSYAHIGINSLGVRVDEWINRSQQEVFSSGGNPQDWNDDRWRAQDALATHVGEDHWTIEYRIDFDEAHIPTPTPGTIWGFNLIRVYRGEEYNQWVRTYSGGHSPDDFGALLFR